jgi:hypothetical protein
VPQDPLHPLRRLFGGGALRPFSFIGTNFIRTNLICTNFIWRSLIRTRLGRHLPGAGRRGGLLGFFRLVGKIPRKPLRPVDAG